MRGRKVRSRFECEDVRLEARREGRESGREGRESGREGVRD